MPQTFCDTPDTCYKNEPDLICNPMKQWMILYHGHLNYRHPFLRIKASASIELGIDVVFGYIFRQSELIKNK